MLLTCATATSLTLPSPLTSSASSVASDEVAASSRSTSQSQVSTPSQRSSSRAHGPMFDSCPASSTISLSPGSKIAAYAAT